MNIADLVTPEHVIAKLRASTKPSVIEQLAERAAAALKMESSSLASLLMARETLGSTGLGHGIALPHTLVKGLPSFFGVLARLERPIDFAAIDGLPVDIVVLLLSPENSGKAHIAALATLTRRLRDAPVVNAMRRARDTRQLYDIFVGAPAAARAS